MIYFGWCECEARGFCLRYLHYPVLNLYFLMLKWISICPFDKIVETGAEKWSRGHVQFDIYSLPQVCFVVGKKLNWVQLFPAGLWENPMIANEIDLFLQTQHVFLSSQSNYFFIRFVMFPFPYIRIWLFQFPLPNGQVEIHLCSCSNYRYLPHKATCLRKSSNIVHYTITKADFEVQHICEGE